MTSLPALAIEATALALPAVLAAAALDGHGNAAFAPLDLATIRVDGSATIGDTYVGALGSRFFIGHGIHPSQATWPWEHSIKKKR